MFFKLFGKTVPCVTSKMSYHAMQYKISLELNKGLLTVLLLVISQTVITIIPSARNQY